jgi:hypothetical protein
MDLTLREEYWIQFCMKLIAVISHTATLQTCMNIITVIKYDGYPYNFKTKNPSDCTNMANKILS